VADGPVSGGESYTVTLDNGAGGGEYLAKQLYRIQQSSAALQAEQQDQYDDGVGGDSSELNPIEAVGKTSRADYFYPELGTILEDRPPNENIKIYARLQAQGRSDTERADAAFEAGHQLGYTYHQRADDFESPDEAAHNFAGDWFDRAYSHHVIDGFHHGLHSWENEDEFGLPHQSALQEPISETDDRPSPYGATHGTDSPDWQADKIAESDEDATPGDDTEQPDTCSWCGSQDFTDFQDTGRGTRARCATCGGTMVKNPEGIQWAPEFPNSSANAASRAGDPRATINDPRAVHASLPLVQADAGDWCRFRMNQQCMLPAKLNPGATSEAGYTIFTPQSRGLCNRYSPVQQMACPTGMPKLTEPGRQVDPLWVTGSLNGLAPHERHEFLFHFTSAWRDVEAKAKRIRAEGGVRVLAATHEGVVGEVRGDTATYEATINYVPGSKRVAAWSCGCKWAAYAWGRSPQYKRFEGRQCSHVAALRFEVGARGMFGRDVAPDVERLEGQHQRSPVQVQYQRPTDRTPGQDIRRRTVPPGNMRRTFSALREDVSPAQEWARVLTATGVSPADVLTGLKGLGLSHQAAREVLSYAVTSAASGTAQINGELHTIVHVDPTANTVTTATGEVHPADAALYPGWHPTIGLDPADGTPLQHAASKGSDEDDEEDEDQEATADPMGGTAEPGTDIPRLELRDQSDAKEQDPRHLLHHTNDARQHATEFGYGLPWGGQYGWCDQCGGSGCGHCGGTGQVEVNRAPASATSGAPGDGSTTNTTVADQSVDAGDMISSDGLSATGYLQVQADYTADSFLTGPPAQNYQAPTPHSNSQNPGSMGFATSADPPNWEQPIIGSGTGITWEASLRKEVTCPIESSVDARTAKKEGDPSLPVLEAPTHAGVAVKAADTGRILMIQRSHQDESDPARGTWELPGGGMEDGDATSLHAAIREFEEEVGQKFPEGGHLTHVWRSGPYVGHVVVIPSESALDFSEGRCTVNPDDPDGDDHEQSAWWDPEHARKNPALRAECRDNPWAEIKKSAAREDFRPHLQGKWDAGYYHGFGGKNEVYDRVSEDAHVYGFRPSDAARAYMDGHEAAQQDRSGFEVHPESEWLLSQNEQGPTKYSHLINTTHIYLASDPSAPLCGRTEDRGPRERADIFDAGYDRQEKCPECHERFKQLPDDVNVYARPLYREGSIHRVSGAGDHEVLYHITDNPHFKLDPDFKPENNTTWGGQYKPGLFTSPSPEAWVNGHNYVRPYVAEIHVPHGLTEGRGYSGEQFLPAEHFDKARVHRVIPLDAHAREQYGSHGWIESHHGTEFDTGRPTEDPSRTGWAAHYPFQYHPDGTERTEPYRYPGPDVRDMSPEQHAFHKERALQMLHGQRGFSDEDVAALRQSWGSRATLHEEPEGALPFTDGAAEGDVVPQSGAEIWPDVTPGIGTDRSTAWGYPQQNPEGVDEATTDPDFSPGSADHDMITDDTVNNSPFRVDAALAAQNPILAEFWKSAGARALSGDGDNGAAPQSGRAAAMAAASGTQVGGEFSDAQIAAQARAMLAKTSAKDFSFAEQQELINEGLSSKARARNFADLRIAGTHYEHLPTDEDHDGFPF
jgi:8-oxo-dGTP pyrophosphatase MutT (NUDIX family)